MASDGLLLSTFSIAARDRATGMLGVAVSTAVPGVGSLCPFAKARVGAVATQAFVNVYLGLDGLRLLEDGAAAGDALEQVIAGDPVVGVEAAVETLLAFGQLAPG